MCDWEAVDPATGMCPRCGADDPISFAPPQRRGRSGGRGVAFGASQPVYGPSVLPDSRPSSATGAEQHSAAAAAPAPPPLSGRVGVAGLVSLMGELPVLAPLANPSAAGGSAAAMPPSGSSDDEVPFTLLDSRMPRDVIPDPMFWRGLRDQTGAALECLDFACKPLSRSTPPDAACWARLAPRMAPMLQRWVTAMGVDHGIVVVAPGLDEQAVQLTAPLWARLLYFVRVVLPRQLPILDSWLAPSRPQASVPMPPPAGVDCGGTGLAAASQPQASVPMPPPAGVDCEDTGLAAAGAAAHGAPSVVYASRFAAAATVPAAAAPASAVPTAPASVPVDPFRFPSASVGVGPAFVQLPSKSYRLRVHVGPRTDAGYLLYSVEARALASMQLFGWLGRVVDLRVFGDSGAMGRWLQRLDLLSRVLPVDRITAVLTTGQLPPLTDFLSSSVLRTDGSLSLRADELGTALTRYHQCLCLLFGDDCVLAIAFAELIRARALSAWYNFGIRMSLGPDVGDGYLSNVPVGDAEAAAAQVLSGFNTALSDWVRVAKTRLAEYHLRVFEDGLRGTSTVAFGYPGGFGTNAAPSYAHIDLERFTAYFSCTPSESAASMARLVGGMVARPYPARVAPYGTSASGFRQASHAGPTMAVATASPVSLRPQVMAATPPPLPTTGAVVTRPSVPRQPRHRGSPIDVSGGLPKEIADIRQRPLVYHDYRTATAAYPWLTDLHQGGRELCIRHLLFGTKRDGPGGQGCDNGTACPRLHLSAVPSL